MIGGHEEGGPQIDVPRRGCRAAMTYARAVGYGGCCLAAAPIKRFDPILRARVVAAFVALVLVGLGLMLFAWLMARWVRRRVQRREVARPKGPLGPSDWEPRPWVPADEGDLASDGDEVPDE